MRDSARAALFGAEGSFLSGKATSRAFSAHGGDIAFLGRTPGQTMKLKASQGHEVTQSSKDHRFHTGGFFKLNLTCDRSRLLETTDFSRLELQFSAASRGLKLKLHRPKVGGL